MNSLLKAGPTKVFLTILLFASSLLFAIEEVQAPGPHGGTLKKAGENYFIEMKTAEKNFYAYLLDIKQKAIGNKELSADVEFLYPDSTTQHIQLKPMGEDGFSSENILSG